MFSITLGIFLFLSPIIILIGKNARWNGGILALQYYQFKTLLIENNILQLQFFQYGIVVLFIVALMQKQKRGFKDKYLGWFLGLSVLSVVMHPKTIPIFITVLLGVLLYYLVSSYTVNIRKILYVIVGVSILNTIFAILQFLGIHFIYSPAGNIGGLMCTSSHLGTYQALAIPICYYFNPYLAIIPLGGLLLSQNLTGFIGMVVGMSYLLWKKIFNGGSIIFMVCLSLIITLMVKFFYFEKLSSRIWAWWETSKAIIRQPIYGYGFGKFQLVHPQFMRMDNPYNIYLEVGYFLGGLGMIVLFCFLSSFFLHYKTSLGKALFASCLIILTIGLGQSFMDFPRLAGTIIIIFALLKITKKEEKDVRNS